jgi:hypothetical protein
MARRSNSRSTRLSNAGRPLRDERLLFIDSDAERLAFHRLWLSWVDGPDVECVSTGDEALDHLGAVAQQVDAVALWPPLADEGAVDFIGVLRRCRSPLRVVAVTSLSPAEFGRCGRMAGIGAVVDSGQPADLVATLIATARSGASVERIVSSRSTPALPPEWALAIYGTPPGQSFHAALD